MLPSDDLRFQSAMRLIDNAEYAEALRHLDPLEGQLSPEDHAAALYWKARCFDLLGEERQARAAVDEGLEQAGVSNPLRICLQLESAALLRVEEGPERAVHEIRSLLDIYAKEMKAPDFQWIYAQMKQDLGKCLLLSGNYPEAAKELEDALSLQDQPLPRYYIQFSLGDAWYFLGDLVKAKYHLEQALSEARSAPKAGISSYYAARLRYELALIAYKQNQFDDAARELERATAVEIQDTDLLRVVDRLGDLLGQARESIRVH
jgi:tetratricopeptide (TPR) repeat protein